MKKTKAILQLYTHPFENYAATVYEHVRSFERYSRFKIISLNTEAGFPSCLHRYEFQAVVLHYSFYDWLSQPPSGFLDYLNRTAAYKIAFFQDEYHNCQGRFKFINDCGLNCVYTLLDLEYVPQVYGKHTNVKKYRYTLTGYVDDKLNEIGARYAKAADARTIDVSYRGRELPFHTGKGGQEKTDIARDFLKFAAQSGLTLDIATNESARIYGNDWYRFLGNSKATLGVESGVSVFDLDQSIQLECRALQAANPGISFDEVHERVLKPHEEKIPYRTSSPRLFEAAALRACQILYEGNYSGIIKPMEHYIPLKKDFSNFDDVLRVFRNKAEREAIVSRAYKHLIESQSYTYRQFIADFDRELIAEGLTPQVKIHDPAQVMLSLTADYYLRQMRAGLHSLRYWTFPGKKAIKSLYTSIAKK